MVNFLKRKLFKRKMLWKCETQYKLLIYAQHIMRKRSALCISMNQITVC